MMRRSVRSTMRAVLISPISSLRLLLTKEKGNSSVQPVTRVPDVFIIESLRFVDEEKQRAEGNFIAHILKLAGRECRYYYIRTRAELKKVLGIFTKSGFKYLHISCHANENGIGLTLDKLSIQEIATIFRPHLENRRIFFSACSIATSGLAEALIKDTGCYSVIGPSRKIDFDEAALFWASLYHLMFKKDKNSMKNSELKSNIVKLTAVFGGRIEYFTATKGPRGFRRVDLEG